MKWLQEVTIIKASEKIHEIKFVDKDTPIKDIYYIVENENPDALLVSDDGKIVGIITDSDIIMKVEPMNFHSETMTAEDIMSSPVISIDADASIEDAIELMREHDIQKLLVTEDGTPVGVAYGEEILEYDEDKWKEIILDQTLDEVYKIMLREPGADMDSVYRKVVSMDRFTDIKCDVEMDLHVYQEGIVLVAYNFIKENPNMQFAEIKNRIKDDYLELLQKYNDYGNEDEDSS